MCGTESYADEPSREEPGTISPNDGPAADSGRTSDRQPRRPIEVLCESGRKIGQDVLTGVLVTLALHLAQVISAILAG